MATAQVPAPKHESAIHHLFAPHRDEDNLQDRYRSLSCALVLIQAGTRIGTGFYISSDGDIVTASHVIGERQYNQLADGKMQISLLNVPFTFVIKDLAGEFTVPLAGIDGNADNWGYDLVILHSKRQAACWLKVGTAKDSKPGEHVITLGYPTLAAGSLTLYTGIVSARLQEELPSGRTIQGQWVKPTNDFFRVQMPISPGISGAPIIDDENQVIGIVTSAGVWMQDLEQLTELQHIRDQQPNQLPPGTIDLGAVTAHLASILHDFASPGYGDAVPMSYLVRTPSPSNPTLKQPAH
jgi:hypothetical protein